MKLKETIEHEGIIKKISGNHLEVEIINVSACAMCESKSHCTLSESTSKIIDIFTAADDYAIGEKVIVQLANHLAFKAVLLAYLIPFSIVVIVLIAGYNLTKNELVSGLVSIGILVPYYVGLKFFNQKIKKMYSFRILRKFNE